MCRQLSITKLTNYRFVYVTGARIWLYSLLKKILLPSSLFQGRHIDYSILSFDYFSFTNQKKERLTINEWEALLYAKCTALCLKSLRGEGKRTACSKPSCTI